MCISSTSILSKSLLTLVPAIEVYNYSTIKNYLLKFIIIRNNYWMLRIIIFLVIIFTIIYLITNFIISKKQSGNLKFIIPILFTLLIVGIIFFILPRFGLNPFFLFQTIISKVIPYLSMLRGII